MTPATVRWRVVDAAAFGRAGADEMLAAMPVDGVILLPTGLTPLPVYEALIARPAHDRRVIAGWRVVQLDEYVGVAQDDRRSLYSWLERTFLIPAGIPASRVVRLHGDAGDLERECAAYDAAVAAVGGIDVAVLGLGPNGHVAFNEPPTPADAPSRVVELAPASRRSNARYWGRESDVPRRGLTAGMATILAARTIVLLVAGGHKAAILERAVRGPIDGAVPASLLRLAADLRVVVDTAAAPPGVSR
jgi:glucosamine-6-phosphate deaminase